MVAPNRFATAEEALSAEFLGISTGMQELHHRYQMPDHTTVNRERMPWATGVLSPPELYASRLWEYPWAIMVSELSRGMSCVDLGSGTSPFPLYLKEVEQAHVIIVDPDIGGPRENHYLGHGVTDEFIGKARLPALPDSMDHIGLPDRSVERVFCISVLEHIQDPRVWRKGLREIARILCPGGRAVLTVDLCAGHFFVHPFDIIRHSGLLPVGSLDLRMPSHRFGSMPTNSSDIDVFGIVLSKDESVVSFSLPHRKDVSLHEHLLSQAPCPVEWGRTVRVVAAMTGLARSGRRRGKALLRHWRGI